MYKLSHHGRTSYVSNHFCTIQPQGCMMLAIAKFFVNLVTSKDDMPGRAAHTRQLCKTDGERLTCRSVLSTSQHRSVSRPGFVL